MAPLSQFVYAEVNGRNTVDGPMRNLKSQKTEPEMCRRLGSFGIEFFNDLYERNTNPKV